MTIANTAYGSGSYFDNIVFGWGLPITSRAENPTKLWYVAPTMAVHSRMRIAALDGRQRCFDGRHEMQILFCWSGEEESSLAVLTSKRLDSDGPPTTSCSRAIDHLSTTDLLFSPAYLRNIGPTCLQYTISFIWDWGRPKSFDVVEAPPKPHPPNTSYPWLGEDTKLTVCISTL